jgi:hypothetical protein
MSIYCRLLHMSTLRPFCFIPHLISVLMCLALFGCATRGVQHHISGYKDCVFSQAMDRLDTAESAQDIARLASAQCQSNLAIINEKLRADNAWMEHYGSNADGYTENLRDRTSTEVIKEIEKARSR